MLHLQKPDSLVRTAVKAILITHTISIIVADTGDGGAQFSFLVLSFIFHGFSVLLRATADIGFIALFSLHWNSKSSMSLIMLPLSILEVESPTASGGLYCTAYILLLLNVLSRHNECSVIICLVDLSSKEHKEHSDSKWLKRNRFLFTVPL